MNGRTYTLKALTSDEKQKPLAFIYNQHFIISLTNVKYYLKCVFQKVDILNLRYKCHVSSCYTNIYLYCIQVFKWFQKYHFKHLIELIVINNAVKIQTFKVVLRSV